MTRYRTIAAALLAAVAAVLTAAEAHAHHPMGGVTPTTFVEGLLSGFGHPILGLDHFAAVVAAGAIAATQGRGIALALTYVLVMLLGAAGHAAGLDLPGAEVLAALAVIALGAVLVWPSAVAFPAALGVFAAAGLIHGYVLGESIIGAEPAPLFAYFVGLAIMQSAIAVGVMLLARRLFAPATAMPLPLRAAGAAIAVAGVWFLVSNLAATA